MATDVFYNGVTMHNVLTRSWEQDTEYDDSATDAILQRFRLEFEGVIHLQTALNPTAARVYTSGVGASPSDAVQLFQQIRAALWEPRGLLEVTFNGKTALRCLYVATGADPDADVDNGPKPRTVNLEYIASDQLFRVRFAIECAKVECITATSPFPQGVLNNRWGITESMDSNFKTTRTIRGKVRISNSLAQNLHALRPMVTPTLESGFRRDNFEFAALPNGLEADYTIVDKQVAVAAPWPATSLRATFEESNESNINCFSQIGVRLEGPPNADKRLMMARAVQIAEARLGDFAAFGNVNDMTTMIESIAFAEEIGEDNAIEFRARLRRVVAGDGASAFIGNLPAGTFGQKLVLPPIPTNYDPGASVVPASWGYNPADPQNASRNPAAVLFALACYLQSPCNPIHGMLQGSSLVQGSIPAQSGAPSQVVASSTQVASLAKWKPVSRLSADAQANLYFSAKSVSVYEHAPRRVALPIAGDVSQLSAPATAFVSLGRGQVVRKITVDGERIGGPPKMPIPLDSYNEAPGNAAVLIHHHVELFPPTLSVDGAKQVHRARGYYCYALTRPPLQTEKLQRGVLPFTNFGVQDTAIAAADLYDGSLGPAPQVSSLQGGPAI